MKEHEAGVSLADPCRKNGVSDSSFYKWKAKFGGMEVSEAKRLKTLEDENTPLKRLLADAMLDNGSGAPDSRAIFGADLLSSDRISSRDLPISGEPETNSSRRDIRLSTRAAFSRLLKFAYNAALPNDANNGLASRCFMCN